MYGKVVNIAITIPPLIQKRNFLRSRRSKMQNEKSVYRGTFCKQYFGSELIRELSKLPKETEGISYKVVECNNEEDRFSVEVIVDHSYNDKYILELIAQSLCTDEAYVSMGKDQEGMGEEDYSIEFKLNANINRDKVVLEMIDRVCFFRGKDPMGNLSITRNKYGFAIIKIQGNRASLFNDQVERIYCSETIIASILNQLHLINAKPVQYVQSRGAPPWWLSVQEHVGLCNDVPVLIKLFQNGFVFDISRTSAWTAISNLVHVVKHGTPSKIGACMDVNERKIINQVLALWPHLKS